MKLRHLIPILLLALCILAAPAAAAGGAGTASNPYVIQTPAELQSIQNDLSAYYVLGNNLDMSGYNFVPIGSTAAPFFGNLDGKGYVISNLTIDLSDTSNIGLFSVIMGGTIKNIKFDNCSLSGNNNVGVLSGRGQSSPSSSTPLHIDSIEVKNCNIISESGLVGGITGVLSGNVIISGCDIITSTITSNSGNLGGIVGSSTTNLTIQDCTTSKCVLSCTGYSAGGICSYGASNGANLQIINCVVEDSVISSSAGGNIGGIIGSVAINGNQYPTYGIIQGCIIRDCVISASASVGGVSGYLSTNNATGNIINCVVESCSIKASGNYAGGITGSKPIKGYGDISGSSVSNTTVQASSYAGGICPTFTRT